MNHNFSVKQIGIICVDTDGFRLELSSEYKRALIGLECFSCINILWWFSRCDNHVNRSTFVEKKPYTRGPDTLGVFATRSPQRPNPIALSCSTITFMDAENGVIGLTYIDAEDKSPVLDIKPYVPSLDRIEQPTVPSWCSHWPKNIETSGDFDWEAEFEPSSIVP